MDEMTLKDLIEVALIVVGAASAVAAITPNPTDNIVLAVIKTALNAIGANWGAAANEVKAGDVLKKKLRERKPPGK